MHTWGDAMRAGVIVVLTGLVAALWPLALYGGDKPAQLPPRHYVFADETAAAEPARLIAKVRDALQRAITDAGLAEPGYPRPCHVTRTPDPLRPKWYTVACLAGMQDSAEADGILFDKNGGFLQLSLIDFPDSRLYLMEIFVVPQLPYPKLQTEERWTIPRVVIHRPQVSGSWQPKIWSALERGVRSLGVSVFEK